MRILVVDDSEINLESAYQTLYDGNELALVDSYDKATALLEPAAYEEVIMDYCQNENLSYRKAEEFLRRNTETFDVVLTDLLMPPTQRGQSTKSAEKYKNVLFPAGMMLALQAVRLGVKYVAVFTGGVNHHDNPGVWMMESLRWGSDEAPQRFMINGSILGFFDECDGGYVAVDDTMCHNCKGCGCRTCQLTGNLFGKNWGGVLQKLISNHG